MFELTPEQTANPLADWPALNRVFTWLKNRELGILLGGLGLQIVVLLGLIAFHAQPLLHGDTVLLRVVPIDPRDLLRGDYVILGYDFSRVPSGGIEGLPTDNEYRNDWKQRQGSTVYVTLVPEPDGRHWKADRFSIHRPARGKYIQGTLVGYNRLDCGIGSYYVQEGTGKKYERAIRNRKLSAEVAVDSDGQAKLRGLRIE